MAAASPQLLADILDSLAEPITFADMDHMIRYMNRAALAHYGPRGGRPGTSLFACHNEQSREAIRQILTRLEAGEDEVLYSEKPEVRLYMRAVRDPEGKLLGYMERRERVCTVSP